ncbi:Hypothetical protein ORPV_1168 [Orpheovirus IHUMI-LCC2]|uniref:Uncharacterized protein n=1 Tax=Orpheovirus IHUMI-LCC2 TaxID=2023057 RepID=A0A2I2L6A0_9VIRU|nr:Hypothetical protein ORPV_1168 [Orpheovirus IHUMI-LCC2]SNW63072.1 Hypothetical protein ORPV_1168 [Orpheovirus IHUMI-LCC2]
MSITYKHQNAASKLLSLVREDKSLVKDCDMECVLEFLNSIVQKDLRVKTCDPNVYCWYDYEGRYVDFHADSIVPLSVYIAHKVCNSKFSYSGVLGKHTELDFTIHDIEYEYCNDSTKCKDDHKLHMDYPDTNYGDDVYNYVLDGLKKHMVGLIPMYSEDYMDETKNHNADVIEDKDDEEIEDENETNDHNADLRKDKDDEEIEDEDEEDLEEYSRHDYLMEYAQHLLDMKLMTNNPCVKLSIDIQNENSSFGFGGFGTHDTFQFQVKLSQLLTLWAHGAAITKYEYGRNNIQIDLKTMNIQATKDCNTYGRDFDRYWNENKEKFDATHNKVMDILNTYPKLNPLDFYNKYNKKLIERCKLLN